MQIWAAPVSRRRAPVRAIGSRVVPGKGAGAAVQRSPAGDLCRALLPEMKYPRVWTAALPARSAAFFNAAVTLGVQWSPVGGSFTS